MIGCLIVGWLALAAFAWAVVHVGTRDNPD